MAVQVSAFTTFEDGEIRDPVVWANGDSFVYLRQGVRVCGPRDEVVAYLREVAEKLESWTEVTV